jgi:hypothetical protein
MANRILYLFLLNFIFVSCETESCKIDFENHSELFKKVVSEIHSSNLKMDSKEPYSRIVKSYTKSTSPFGQRVFEEVEFIECHEDGTIIFQAPNCNSESDFSDAVYFLAYIPMGEAHIKRKRNIGELEKVAENWFYGTHIYSLAN